jgi:heme-degrading monooxygenase HmoA
MREAKPDDALAIYVRTRHSVQYPFRKIGRIIDTLHSAIPLMRERKGFQALLVLRVEKSNPPDVRVMTIWETQQALHESENCVYFYQALARALAFAKGFPVLHEEEVVLYDFAKVPVV